MQVGYLETQCSEEQTDQRDGKGAEGHGADESQDRGDMRVESLREPVRRRSGDSGGCTAEGRVRCACACACALREGMDEGSS